MSRVLPNGCYVLVDPDQREPIVNGRPYALCVNGYDATVKRVRQLANGLELIPDSLDPTYRAQVFDSGVEGTETITIIGRVVWHTFPYDWEY
jgi:repressor LexA